LEPPSGLTLSDIANCLALSNVGPLKPISQFSDDHLRGRLLGLSKNLFFLDGQLRIPSEISLAIRETFAEAGKRGPIPDLGLEKLIDPKDPAPVFHEKSRVRYASKDRLESFRSGVVTLSPASCYSGLDNAAQRDDELQRSWHMPDTILTIGGVEYPASDLVLRRGMKETGGGSINYHCLAMSTEESVKLQRAFGAEGYVLVHDYRAFYELLSKALLDRFGKLHCCSSRITYYDDCQEPQFATLEDLLFSKSFLYQYQSEVRFCVLDAPSPEERLEVTVSWPSGLLSTVKSLI
jgi:hypothetical protein